MSIVGHNYFMVIPSHSEKVIPRKRSESKNLFQSPPQEIFRQARNNTYVSVTV